MYDIWWAVAASCGLVGYLLLWIRARRRKRWQARRRMH